jgi:hypothetical protein
MHPTNENKRSAGLEGIAAVGVTICATALALLLGTALVWFAYHSIPPGPYRYLLSAVVVLLFAIVVFSLVKMAAAERRRRRQAAANSAMPTASPTDYLINRVRLSVREFANNTRWLFRAVRLYKYATVGLSLLATIVLGLNLGHLEGPQHALYAATSKNIALVLNALVAAITTLSVFWNVEKYWVQNKVIKHQLRSLLADIEFEMSRNNGAVTDGALLQTFFARHQAILKNFHFYWEGVLTERGEAKGQQKG